MAKSDSDPAADERTPEQQFLDARALTAGHKAGERPHFVVAHSAIGMGSKGTHGAFYRGEPFFNDEYDAAEIDRLQSLGAIVPFDSDEGQKIFSEGDIYGAWGTPLAALSPETIATREKAEADAKAKADAAASNTGANNG